MSLIAFLPILATVALGTDGASTDEHSDGALADPFVGAESSTRSQIERPVDWAEDHTKFAFKGSLDTLFMGVVGGNDIETATGLDATLIFERALFGNWLDNSLTLYGRVRLRTGIWDQAPSELGSSIGTIWGVVDGFTDAGFELPDFFFRQVLPNRNLEFRYGQMVIDAQLDGQPTGGAKTAFHNRAFSSNPAAAFPRLGAGATAAWDPEGPWDFVYAITTVQGSQAGDQVDFKLASSSYFQALQFGYSFPGKDPGPRRLQLMLWHSDPPPRRPRRFGRRRRTQPDLLPSIRRSHPIGVLQNRLRER